MSDTGNATDGRPQCGLPGCDRPQEFPDAQEARCVGHSLEWYFHWTPLAEFSIDRDQDTEREQ